MFVAPAFNEEEDLYDILFHCLIAFLMYVLPFIDHCHIFTSHSIFLYDSIYIPHVRYT